MQPETATVPDKLTRRLLLGASLAAPSLPRHARGAETTWRLAHNAPVSFALHRRLLGAAEAIATQSDGRMNIAVLPDNELGSPVGLLAQLRAGTLDAAPLSNQVLANDLPVTALPMTGFAFDGYDQLWRAIDGGTGGFIRGRLKQRLGLIPMDRCWDFGFHQITTTSKPVANPGDLDGLKLRMPAEEIFVTLFRALKALPIAVGLNGLLRALTVHSVDGQESVLPLVSAAGLAEVQSRCAMTNHIWDGQWLCISGGSWSKLPAKLKDVVATALDEAARQQRADIASANATLRQDLAGQGIAFNDVDPSAFRAVLRQSGYYAALKAKLGADAWSVLETDTGRLV